MIHDKYFQMKENKVLLPGDVNVPLTILHPDDEGNTALDVAIKQERPKSFELMIDMLEPFDNFCLSKMLLTCFPHMIE
jgi:hypothetical protein